jgi:hypothetical protein
MIMGSEFVDVDGNTEERKGTISVDGTDTSQTDHVCGANSGARNGPIQSSELNPESSQRLKFVLAIITIFMHDNS